MQALARTLRQVVLTEVPEATERFTGGMRPLALYATTADICWIQPFKAHCNIYFPRGMELTDPAHILQGTSDRYRFAQVHSRDDLEELPLRQWIRESLALNEVSVMGGMKFEQVLDKLRAICLILPNTKETLTWGSPHFRVGEKIFCGCGQDQGRPKIGLKMARYQSEVMMKAPGIEKAPYSRKGDGWVAIDPLLFDDWTEIESFLVQSYRLIAPKRTVALLDSQRDQSESARRPTRRNSQGNK